jgi:hypothetical protein
VVTEADLDEYLAEIRAQVCGRCVERPPGGPPCAPLGKVCGVELHLPALVRAVREVKSDLIAPYLENNGERVCRFCRFLDRDICPCPLRYLAVLIVEAVDQRRGQHRPLA